jgi:hypothetical protein
LSLPAAGFLPGLSPPQADETTSSFKVSPDNRASQYHVLKNKMTDSRIRPLREPKGRLSPGPEVIFFLKQILSVVFYHP